MAASNYFLPYRVYLIRRKSRRVKLAWIASVLGSGNEHWEKSMIDSSGEYTSESKDSSDEENVSD